jgi:hypothetical protein
VLAASHVQRQKTVNNAIVRLLIAFLPAILIIDPGGRATLLLNAPVFQQVWTR